MKVIFLDVDGVLIAGEDIRRTRDVRRFDPVKIARLNRVCAVTGARVVVSSTWRRGEDFPDVLRAAGFTGDFHEDWRTDKGYDMRGRQIGAWLDAHPDVRGYCIVDDDTDMLKKQKPFFVRTDFDTGLTEIHASRMIGVLCGTPVRAQETRAQTSPKGPRPNGLEI